MPDQPPSPPSSSPSSSTASSTTASALGSPREAPLRVALLQCGHIHADLVAEHGDYPEAFADLLGPHGVELTTFDVAALHEDGQPLPDDPGSFDGWLVSGSASSAYEPLGWIPPLEDLLRLLLEEQAPMVAICFGHQVLAQATGGRVAKARVGWGVGAHDYRLVGPTRSWMVPAPPSDHVRIIASHQDQVVDLPPGAEVVATTEHCPIAAYTLGSALAIQPHPEFTPGVSRGLIERRRQVIGEELSDEALASLAVPVDSDLVAAWMVRFLRDAGSGRTSVG